VCLWPCSCAQLSVIAMNADFADIPVSSYWGVTCHQQIITKPPLIDRHHHPSPAHASGRATVSCVYVPLTPSHSGSYLALGSRAWSSMLLRRNATIRPKAPRAAPDTHTASLTLLPPPPSAVSASAASASAVAASVSASAASASALPLVVVVLLLVYCCLSCCSRGGSLVGSGKYLDRA